MERSVEYVSAKNAVKGFLKMQNILICIYFFLAFFEPYLNGVMGSLGKYYILLLIGVIILCHKDIKLKSFHWCFLFWLIYKIISLLWTNNLYIAQSHMFSQIGMIGLLIILTAIPLDKQTISNIKFSIWMGSLAIGILAVFLSHPYHGTVETRQVLLLFGQEADPNNQAAFLLIGLTIALYELVLEKRYIILSIGTLIINTYTLFMTGSRGGLVGLAGVLLCIFFLAIRKMNIMKRLKILIAVCILVAGLLWIAVRFLPEEIFERLFNFDSYEGGSERTEIWGNVLELIFTRLNVIFGAGWGDYYGYNAMYKVVHNTFLSMWCDVGLLGVILFFLPIAMVMLALLKRKDYLPILLIVCCFIPSFFIEAINKRFFWNVIFYLFISFVNWRDTENDASQKNFSSQLSVRA